MAFYLCTVKNLSLRSILLGSGIALFVPVICYFILRSAGHTGHVYAPPHYGIDSIRETTQDGVTQYDTVFHQIQNAVFTNHLNEEVNLSTDYPRRMLVISFFDTKNKLVSDKISYHIGHIQNGFRLKKTDTSIQMVSISTGNPSDDLPTVRAYANSNTYDHDTWDFLLSDSTKTARFAKEELFLSDNDQLRKDYKSQIILVDKYRNIRGYYDGLDSMQVKDCIDDMAIMMVEKNKIHEKKKR
jgi:protein SCO1/2